MKQRLARIISLSTSHINGFIKPNTQLISSSSSLSSQKHRLFTSKNDGVTTQQSSSEQNNEEPINEADDDINNDLKKGLKRLREGDGEAIPSIFEALLKSHLAGKGEESHEELMKELRELPLVDEDDETDKEFDSDDDEGDSEFDSDDDDDDELKN